MNDSAELRGSSLHSPVKTISNVLLFGGLIIAFVDESVRKILPEQPVVVTAAKDILWVPAGLLAFEMYKHELRRFLGFFLCWTMLALASSLYMGLAYGSVIGVLASLKVYGLFSLWFFCGYYLGKNDVVRRRYYELFMLGSVVALIVTFLQEFARDSLPPFLSTRIYIESHPLAGGTYNESLFATMYILSKVLLYAVAISFIWFSGQKRISSALWVWSLLGISVIFAGIVLSRSRVTLMLGVFFLLVIWALSAYKQKTDKSHIATRKLASGLCVVLGLGAVLIFAFMPAKDPEDSLGRDVEFFKWLVDPDELAHRFMWLFEVELEGLKDHNWFFGYGAGAGTLQPFYPGLPDDIPAVLDTGLFMIVNEFGLFGLLFFFICFGGLTVSCLQKILASPHIPGSVLPLFAINVTFLILFSWKYHVTLRNGFSQFLWLSSLGICCAQLSDCQSPMSARFDVAVSDLGEPLAEDRM
jgi:hypothetical protein